MPGVPMTAIGAEWEPGPDIPSPSSPGPSSPAPSSPGPSSAETRSFARRAEEVTSARRFIRKALADHPGSMDAELLACELVTNAVQHATDATVITVVVMRQGRYVRVEVFDDGYIGLPHWREDGGGPYAERGRGFQLVNEIAHRWGFVREKTSTCVWFEIAPG